MNPQVSTRVGVSAAVVAITGMLLGGCEQPFEPQPIVATPAYHAAGLPETSRPAPLVAAALDDLAQRVLPALGYGDVGVSRLRTALDALRAAADDGGTVGAPLLERAIAATHDLAAAPEARHLAADLEVARLTLEQALALVESSDRARLHVRLHAREPDSTAAADPISPTQ